MTRHTPGPWTAVPDSHEDSEGDWYVIAPNEDVIATGLSELDARLIAAAPVMLAALHAVKTELRDTDNDNQDLWERVCAAIAKAEGVS